MVDASSIVSSVAGFAPAFILLYFTLKDYTYPEVEKPFFDDRRVFMFFAFGIIIGMVIFAFESWGRQVSGEETIVILVLLFAVMESSMKLVILNLPRFQRKVDTAFLGIALGLGIAATYTFATVYTSLLAVEEPGAFEYIAFSLIGLQLVLLQGATTAYIAIGVVRGKITPYFSEALLTQLGYNLLMIPFFTEAEPWNYLGIAAASAVVVYSYYKLVTLSLPVLIKDAKKLVKPAAS
jgi:hypothetical protein